MIHTTCEERKLILQFLIDGLSLIYEKVGLMWVWLERKVGCGTVLSCVLVFVGLSSVGLIPSYCCSLRFNFILLSRGSVVSQILLSFQP